MSVVYDVMSVYDMEDLLNQIPIDHIFVGRHHNGELVNLKKFSIELTANYKFVLEDLEKLLEIYIQDIERYNCLYECINIIKRLFVKIDEREPLIYNISNEEYMGKCQYIITLWRYTMPSSTFISIDKRLYPFIAVTSSYESMFASCSQYLTIDL